MCKLQIQEIVLSIPKQSLCLHQAINMMKDEVGNFGLMVQLNCLQQARVQDTHSLENYLLAIYSILNTKN